MKNTQRKTMKSYITLKQRITAAVTAVVMLAQICIPTVALATTAWSGNFESRLASELNSPMIELINDQYAPEAYTGAFFIHKSTINHTTLDSFYENYAKDRPELKPAQKPKLIGDSFVQTRLIRAQYRSLMGRYFFSGVLRAEEVEADAINNLYGAAKGYAARNNLTLGSPLSNASSAPDMIWPELKQINGKSYLVPVVHLSQATLKTGWQDDHLIQFDSNATFAGIQLDFATLITGYDSVVTGLHGIINNQSSIKSPGNLTLSGCENTPQISDPYSTSILGNIHCSGTIANLGGTIDVAGTLNVYAKDVINKTLVVPYKDKNGEGTRLGRVAEIKAGDIQIFADGNIDFVGASAISEGRFFLNAANDINIRPAQTGGTNQSHEGHWEINKSTTDLIMSRLAAEDTLSLIAGGVINITASELISSRGGIELLAGEGIHILDELEQTSIQKEDRKGKTKGTSSEFRTEAVRAILNAGKGVLLDSEYGDVVLRATQLTSTSGTEVYARNGKVHLLMTKELEEFHLQTTRKGTWTIKTRTEDIVHENNIQNAILGGLQVQAKYGINVEYTGKEGATLKEQIEEYRKMPEMKWMAELYDQAVVDGGQNVNWEVIEEVHKELKKTKRNLSPAAMAIIAIAVCVAMGPAGAGLIGSGGSISAAVVTAGGNAALGAALSAGAVALTTQAAQSLASGNNLRETISGFDSSDSLKSLAVAMVTAGAMQAAQVDMFQVPEGASVDALNLAKQAGQAVVNSAVSAGVSTVIYGGNSENFLSSFKQGLMTSAVNKIGEKMANKIGSAYKDGDINNVVRYVAHAGAGCVMGLGLAGASNSSNDESLSCFSGAGGAVVGELAADAYKAQKIEDLAKQYEGYASQLRAQGATNATIEAAFQSPEMQDLMNQQMADLKAVGVDLAKLSGAFAALAAGGDVSIAAQTGENAAKNNALFLIPLAIIALKAIDVALTAKELWDIYDTNKNNPEGLSKALAEWLAIEAGGAAVGKVIPGFKTAQEMIDWLRKNDVLSVSMVDGIEKSFKGFKGEQPDSAPNVLNDAPTPDNPLDLTAVGGKASFVKQMTVPNNAIRNDGILGEQVAEQIIGDATGLTFRTTLKNNSNNGVDLIAIDEKTNTIWIIEVKSSINGQFPSVQSQNLVTRSKDWILNASNGSINNQQLDPAEVEYAQKIQDMVKNGWNLKPMYSTVSIPKPNTTGPATVTIQPVI